MKRLRLVFLVGLALVIVASLIVDGLHHRTSAQFHTGAWRGTGLIWFDNDTLKIDYIKPRDNLTVNISAITSELIIVEVDSARIAYHDTVGTYGDPQITFVDTIALKGDANGIAVIEFPTGVTKLGTGTTDTVQFAGEVNADLNLTAVGTVQAEQLTTTDDLALPATGIAYFDGQGGHTYVTESGDDTLDVYVGGANMLKMMEGATDLIALTGNTTVTGTFNVTSTSQFDDNVLPDASQGANIGASGTEFNLMWADSVHANWLGGSDFELGESGSDVTVDADSIKGAPVWHGALVVSGDETITGNIVPSSGAAHDLGSATADWDSIFADDMDLDGNLTVGGTTTLAGDLLPSADDTHHLGSANLRWADGFFNQITLGDSTTGDHDGWVYHSDDGTVQAHAWGYDDGEDAWKTTDNVQFPAADSIQVDVLTLVEKLEPDASQGADIGASGTEINLVWADSVHANWLGGSDFELGDSGSDVTVDADSVKSDGTTVLFGIDHDDLLDKSADETISARYSFTDTVEVGDGSYSWTHTPNVGIEGILEIDGELYPDAGLTIATGQNLTVGTTQWDNAADSLDGEIIAAATIDDDALDFSDITFGDFTDDVGYFRADGSVDMTGDIGFDAATHDIGTAANHVDSLFVSVIQPASVLSIGDSVSVTGNVAATTYGSDGSISDAELLTWDDGATTQIAVGGGAGSAPVWGADIPTAVTIGTAYIYRVGGTDVADGDVADNITITNISQVADITATASEINTPLDGASVTLTEFQELEAIGATTISANQWAALGGIAETLTSAELDILDGVTGVTAAELSYIGDVTGLIQAQLDARCLESVFGTAVSTGLTLDGTDLKVSTGLQSLSGLTLTAGDMAIATGANAWNVLDAGATTEILVGGGAANPVWTTATGSGAPMRGTSPVLTTSIDLATNAANLLVEEEDIAGATNQFWVNGDTLFYNDGGSVHYWLKTGDR